MDTIYQVYTTDEIVVYIGITIFFIILFRLRNKFPKNSTFSPSWFLPSWMNKVIKYLLAASALSVIIILIIITLIIMFIGTENTLLFIEEKYSIYEEYLVYYFITIFVILAVIILPLAVKYIDID